MDEDGVLQGFRDDLEVITSHLASISTVVVSLKARLDSFEQSRRGSLVLVQQQHQSDGDSPLRTQRQHIASQVPFPPAAAPTWSLEQSPPRQQPRQQDHEQQHMLGSPPASANAVHQKLHAKSPKQHAAAELHESANCMDHPCNNLHGADPGSNAQPDHADARDDANAGADAGSDAHAGADAGAVVDADADDGFRGDIFEPSYFYMDRAKGGHISTNMPECFEGENKLANPEEWLEFMRHTAHVRAERRQLLRYFLKPNVQPYAGEFAVRRSGDDLDELGGDDSRYTDEDEISDDSLAEDGSDVGGDEEVSVLGGEVDKLAQRDRRRFKQRQQGIQSSTADQQQQQQLTSNVSRIMAAGGVQEPSMLQHLVQQLAPSQDSGGFDPLLSRVQTAAMAEITQAIAEAVEHVVAEWRRKKLPRLQAKASAIWHEAQQSSGTGQKVAQMWAEDLAHWQGRLAKLSDELAHTHVDNVEAFKRAQGRHLKSLEQTIHDIQALMYKLEVAQQAQCPADVPLPPELMQGRGRPKQAAGAIADGSQHTGAAAAGAGDVRHSDDDASLFRGQDDEDEQDSFIDDGNVDLPGPADKGAEQGHASNMELGDAEPSHAWNTANLAPNKTEVLVFSKRKPTLKPAEAANQEGGAALPGLEPAAAAGAEAQPEAAAQTPDAAEAAGEAALQAACASPATPAASPAAATPADTSPLAGITSLGAPSLDLILNEDADLDDEPGNAIMRKPSGSLPLDAGPAGTQAVPGAKPQDAAAASAVAATTTAAAAMAPAAALAQQPVLTPFQGALAVQPLSIGQPAELLQQPPKGAWACWKPAGLMKAINEASAIVEEPATAQGGATNVAVVHVPLERVRPAPPEAVSTVQLESVKRGMLLDVRSNSSDGQVWEPVIVLSKVVNHRTTWRFQDSSGQGTDALYVEYIVGSKLVTLHCQAANDSTRILTFTGNMIDAGHIRNHLVWDAEAGGQWSTASASAMLPEREHSLDVLVRPQMLQLLGNGSSDAARHMFARALARRPGMQLKFCRTALEHYNVKGKGRVVMDRNDDPQLRLHAPGLPAKTQRCLKDDSDSDDVIMINSSSSSGEEEPAKQLPSLLKRKPLASPSPAASPAKKARLDNAREQKVQRKMDQVRAREQRKQDKMQDNVRKMAELARGSQSQMAWQQAGSQPLFADREFPTVAGCIADKLKPHQWEGLRFAWRNLVDSCFSIGDDAGSSDELESGCILAHTMGLGKSLTTIAFLHAYFSIPKANGNPAGRALLVTPANVTFNFFHEFHKWLPAENHPDASTSALTPQKVFLHTSTSGTEKIDKWADSHGGVLIISPNMFQRFVDGTAKVHGAAEQQLKELGRKLLKCPEVVVVDEAHGMKNANTQYYKALSQVQTGKRLALTGYPLQNNLDEYYTMVCWVNKDFLGTPAEFKQEFVEVIEAGRQPDATRTDKIKMQSRLAVLDDLTQGFVQCYSREHLERQLADQGVSKTEHVVLFRLNEVQEDLYQTFLQEVMQRGNKSLFGDFEILRKVCNAPEVLAKFLEDGVKCPQAAKMDADEEDDQVITVIPAQHDDEAERPRNREGASTQQQPPSAFTQQSTGKAKRGCKPKNSSKPNEEHCIPQEICQVLHSKLEQHRQQLQAAAGQGVAGPSNGRRDDVWGSLPKNTFIEKLIEHCRSNNEKLVIYTQQLAVLNTLEAMLQRTWGLQQDVDFFRIQGKVESGKRAQIIDNFNKDSRFKVMLASTMAASVGINLTTAFRLVVYDVPWNPVHNAQAIARIFRIGQTQPTFVYRLIYKSTLEESIYRINLQKEELFHKVINKKGVKVKYAEDIKHYTYKPVPALPHDELMANLGSASRKDTALLTILSITAVAGHVVDYRLHDSLLPEDPDEKVPPKLRKEARRLYQQEQMMMKEGDKGWLKRKRRLAQAPKSNEPDRDSEEDEPLLKQWRAPPASQAPAAHHAVPIKTPGPLSTPAVKSSVGPFDASLLAIASSAPAALLALQATVPRAPAAGGQGLLLGRSTSTPPMVAATTTAAPSQAPTVAAAATPMPATATALAAAPATAMASVPVPITAGTAAVVPASIQALSLLSPLQAVHWFNIFRGISSGQAAAQPGKKAAPTSATQRTPQAHTNHTSTAEPKQQAPPMSGASASQAPASTATQTGKQSDPSAPTIHQPALMPVSATPAPAATPAATPAAAAAADKTAAASSRPPVAAINDHAAPKPGPASAITGTPSGSAAEAGHTGRSTPATRQDATPLNGAAAAAAAAAKQQAASTIPIEHGPAAAAAAAEQAALCKPQAAVQPDAGNSSRQQPMGEDAANSNQPSAPSSSAAGSQPLSAEPAANKGQHQGNPVHRQPASSFLPSLSPPLNKSSTQSAHEGSSSQQRPPGKDQDPGSAAGAWPRSRPSTAITMTAVPATQVVTNVPTGAREAQHLSEVLKLINGDSNGSDRKKPANGSKQEMANGTAAPKMDGLKSISAGAVGTARPAGAAAGSGIYASNNTTATNGAPRMEGAVASTAGAESQHKSDPMGTPPAPDPSRGPLPPGPLLSKSAVKRRRISSKLPEPPSTSPDEVIDLTDS